eukprot:COSAG02_NODE_55974_length_287_cov_2.409574_1_plen_52_part_01
MERRVAVGCLAWLEGRTIPSLRRSAHQLLINTRLASTRWCFDRVFKPIVLVV